MPSKSIIEGFNNEMAHVIMMYTGWAQEEGYNVNDVISHFGSINTAVIKEFNKVIIPDTTT